MELSRYSELFLSEAREHLASINRLLLELEAQPGNGRTVDGIFRAVHTVKGAAATMGYQRATAVAHAIEHLLEQLRAGTVHADAEVLDLLFQGADALERAVEQPAEATGEAVLSRLRASTAPAPSSEGVAPAGGEEPEATGAEEEGGAVRRYQVRVTIASTSPFPAVRAVMALRNARRVGGVEAVEPDEARIQAGELDGALRFLLTTGADPDGVRSVLVEAGEVEEVTVEPVMEPAPSVLEEAAERGGEVIVRVQQGRLDGLVDQVGELVIARDRLRRASQGVGEAELEEAVEAVSRLVGDLRDEIMRLRMVPVGEVFDRFPRLVRDAARALGKRVDFEMAGRWEEVDRSLLNEIADLLVHLLRNAVDHGIESPEERRSAGKPEVGKLRLAALRDAGAVVVRVEDDGRGLQRERITRAAVERGLLAPEAAESLTDAEVHRLITRAGLSTAEQVTDVSGRGVGMDVVQSRVVALGGSLDVRSREGEGATFTLRLPLSLAILRTLLLEAAGERYCVPIASVAEVLDVRASDVTAADEGARELRLRDAVVPVLDLRALLAPDGEPPAPDVIPAVVLRAGEMRFAMLVDALHGHHEAVVKPFDATLGMPALFSGATVLADGTPSLILDPVRLGESLDAGQNLQPLRHS